jgi:Lrp/AsnC family leucine-responsive transcriptional regulator
MLDETDVRILQALIQDARATLKDVADHARLSSPSAAERMRRLQEGGVIRAYTIDLDPRLLGYSLQAIVRIRPLPGKVHIVQQLLEDIAEVCECHKVTGEDCFIARVAARSMEQLDEIVDRISEKAETNTSIVKSQPIARRPPPLQQPPEQRAKSPVRRRRRS